MPLSVAQMHNYFFLSADPGSNLNISNTVLWFSRFHSNMASCGHHSGRAQDGTWLVCSLWEGQADRCFQFWGEGKRVFLPVYCKQHPVRTVGSDCAHLDFWEPQDLSPLHQIISDMTRIHITSSARVKGGVVWNLCPSRAQGREAKQNQSDRCKGDQQKWPYQSGWGREDKDTKTDCHMLSSCSSV